MEGKEGKYEEGRGREIGKGRGKRGKRGKRKKNEKRCKEGKKIAEEERQRFSIASVTLKNQVSQLEEETCWVLMLESVSHKLHWLQVIASRESRKLFGG